MSSCRAHNRKNSLPFLLLLTRSTLLFHTLATRRFAGHLLDFTIAVALRVAVRRGGFHGVDARLFVF